MSLWHRTCHELCVQLQGAIFLMTNSKHSRVQLWFGIPSWAARTMTLKEVCLIGTKSSILSWNMNKIHGVIRHRRHVTGLSSFLLLVFASEDMHLAPDGIHVLLQENTAVLLLLPLLLSRLFAFAFVTPGLSCAGWRGSTLYLLCRENKWEINPAPLHIQPELLCVVKFTNKKFKYYANQ